LGTAQPSLPNLQKPPQRRSKRDKKRGAGSLVEDAATTTTSVGGGGEEDEDAAVASTSSRKSRKVGPHDSPVLSRTAIECCPLSRRGVTPSPAGAGTGDDISDDDIDDTDHGFVSGEAMEVLLGEIIFGVASRWLQSSTLAHPSDVRDQDRAAVGNDNEGVSRNICNDSSSERDVCGGISTVALVLPTNRTRRWHA
jgi:hypothetical protein